MFSEKMITQSGSNNELISEESSLEDSKIFGSDKEYNKNICYFFIK